MGESRNINTAIPPLKEAGGPSEACLLCGVATGEISKASIGQPLFSEAAVVYAIETIGRVGLDVLLSEIAHCAIHSDWYLRMHLRYAAVWGAIKEQRERKGSP